MRLFLLIFFPFLLFASNTKFSLGEKLYKEACISCHGKNGKSNTDMHLPVKPRKLDKSILTQNQSFQIIKYGAHPFGAHADIMPTFKYIYDDTQIEALSVYITEKFNSNRDKKIQTLLNKSKYSPSNANIKTMLERGKKIFLKKCAKCHGKTGDGQSEYVRQSKNSDSFIYPYNLQKILLTPQQIFLFSKYGGHFWGTDKDDMPAWGKKYNDEQLQAVALYIEQYIIQR